MEFMPRPIFIMGSMRSGTTLLRLMLDSHQALAIGWETGFARAIKHTKSVPDFIYGDGWYRRYGITDEEMNSRLRQFYSSIFEQYARREGARRWGEKTPLNVFRIHDLDSIFPDSQFLWIVRHPCAVVASLAKWDYGLEYSVKYWNNVYERLFESYARLGERRVHCLRFEDLVLEPRSALESAVDFLDEPWCELMLRHYEVQPAKGVTVVEGGSRADQAVDPERVGDWLVNLDAETRSAISKASEQLMTQFGYQPDESLPRGPIVLP